MIRRPLRRRSMMAGGLAVAVTLSGCSVSDLTKGDTTDADAADRARLTRARDLSHQLLSDLEATVADKPGLTGPLAGLRRVHQQQIEQFTRSAGLQDLAPTRSSAPIPLAAFPAREHALSQRLRALALAADRGDVAALLASAAAGIDQAVIGVPR